MTYRTLLILGALALFIGACGDDEPGDEYDCDDTLLLEEGDPPPEYLSDYCFFEGAPNLQQPQEGVIPYDLTSPLYSDKSLKQRFIVLPEGETIDFDVDERWGWPDPSIIIKTFYYPTDATDPDAPDQLLETRLLIKRGGEWETQSYIWEDDQGDAVLNNLGASRQVEYIDEDGDTVSIDYRIPNRNQCVSCHGHEGDLKPIGPRTNQMTHPYGGHDDDTPQLEALADMGLFDQEPPPVDEIDAMVDPRDESASLDDRARSYLDANCAHCHAPGSRASSSNLHLDYDEPFGSKIGICKTPVAAGSAAGGRPYDIVPGEPDESIMVFRMETTDSDKMMPELPNTTIDAFGVQLVRDWISAMEPVGCN